VFFSKWDAVFFCAKILKCFAMGSDVVLGGHEQPGKCLCIMYSRCVPRVVSYVCIEQ